MQICEFCQIGFNIVKHHSKFCEQNPNRSLSRSGVNASRYGIPGRNQFSKAVQEGRKVEVSEETRKKLRESNLGNKWSEERKKRHSESMLEAVKKHPDSYSTSNVSGRVKTYWFDGMKFKGLWELKVAKCLKDAGIKYTNIVVPFEYEYCDTIRLYFPDFYLEDYNLYIEVKGYERYRDFCKWKVVDNLVVFKAKEIRALDTVPIKTLLEEKMML